MDLFPDIFQSTAKNCPLLTQTSAIMESVDSPSLIMTFNNQHVDDNRSVILNNIPDVALNSDFPKLKIESPLIIEDDGSKSVLLLNEKEQLKISSVEEFLKLLKCEENSRVKVISIFGNTGDGKSYTLNECFFDKKEVFRTSSEQDSCTVGVWVAYDPKLNIICLDTEGLLGSTSNENQRTRLLLKVLAISDIIIYRTRSERLHRDLFTFLGTASKAYTHHFHTALQFVSQKAELNGTLSALGPAVIIFHETRHTKPLRTTKLESAEDIIRSRFAQLHLDIEAFSSLKYIGVQTFLPPTNFFELRNSVILELENTTVRSCRSPKIVYLTLKILNEKFYGEIEDVSYEIMFPDQYFTCPATCLSCEKRCSRSMGHLNDNLPHVNDNKCKYEHQYGNCLFVCKSCHTNGKETVVLPRYSTSSESSWYGFAKYAWSGYVIECPHHGEIYRSRQFWYGNNEPEVSAVRSEIKHVWPGNACGNQSLQNSAQRVIDGVTYISEAVSSVSLEPSKYLSSWAADKVAPKYWEPNSQIKCCAVCQKVFSYLSTKHHCRACGRGVCESCSMNNRPVPERGWTYPVRVCDKCCGNLVSADTCSECSDVSSDDTEVRVRKVSEAVVNTISSVASVLEYPKALIKDSARPSYWLPDNQIHACCVCQTEFGTLCSTKHTIVRLHHCRNCGDGVCSSCSTKRIPVPHRGWNQPVRVCDNCSKLK